MPGIFTRRVGSIFQKEFKDIFRDRRTVMSVIISPLVITPLLFMFIGIVSGGQAKKAQEETLQLGIVGKSASPKVSAILDKIPLTNWQSLSPDEIEKSVHSRKVIAAFVIPNDADNRLLIGSTIKVEAWMDEGEQKSQVAVVRVQKSLGMIGAKIAKERLVASNLPADYAEPFKLEEKPIKQGGTGASFFLAMILPYTLAISAFTGAIYAAFDQVAGEKERGTLETLLLSPATRRDIVLGKYFAVVSVCLVSSVLSVVGMVLTLSLKVKALEFLGKGGISLSPGAIGVTLLVMIPLATLFAGLLLAVSTFARNQKEAQTYLSPIMMLILLPAMSSMFVGSDAGLPMAFIPVLNSSIIIKQALSGSYNPAFIVTAIAASIVYAGVMLTYTTHIFQKESVLIKA